MFPRDLLSLTALTFALSLASPALAEGPSSEKPSLEQARAAFLEGSEFMEAEEWAKAEERFSYAIGARNTPGLHYYVGYCREKQGRLIEALASYRVAEGLLETNSAADVKQILPEAVERVMKDMPQLHLRDVPPGATLEVDGSQRPLSTQFSLNPGRHTVVVTKPGYTRFSETFTLKPGVRGRIYVVMAPIDEGQPEDVDPFDGQDESKPSGAKQAVFWSGVGVGVVGLGVGIAGTVIRSSSNQELEDLNNAFDGDDSACVAPSESNVVFCDDFARVADRKNLGTGLMLGGFIGAGLGGATALVTHFLWPNEPIQVEAQATSGGGFLSVSGDF